MEPRGRSKAARLIASTAVLAASAGCWLGSSGEGIPDPSTCNNAPSTAPVDDVAVGTAPGPFIAIEDDAPTYVAVDEYGHEWVAIRAAWRGPAAPACAEVRIALRDPATDAELNHFSDGLTSSPHNDWRVSDEVFFRTEGLPSTVIAAVEVYGAVARRRVRIGGFMPPMPDAGE